MDLLTHLFLPLAVAYVALPDRFATPWTLGLAIFGVLPDADKLIGLQGAFHTVPFVLVCTGFLLAGEYALRGRVRYAPIAAALLASHLALDFLDGGPVFLVAPGVTPGVGLTFPTTISFGGTPTNVGVDGLLPRVRTNPVDRGPATYQLVTGYGVLSAIVCGLLLRFGGRTPHRERT